MQFKITITWSNGKRDIEWHDLAGTREELQRITAVLDAIIPGESITIERLS